jgi:hypothetical protein
MHSSRDIGVAANNLAYAVSKPWKQPIEKAWHGLYGGTHKATVGDTRSSCRPLQNQIPGVIQRGPMARKARGREAKQRPNSNDQHNHLTVFQQVNGALDG